MPMKHFVWNWLDWSLVVMLITMTIRLVLAMIIQVNYCLWLLFEWVNSHHDNLVLFACAISFFRFYHVLKFFFPLFVVFISSPCNVHVLLWIFEFVPVNKRKACSCSLATDLVQMAPEYSKHSTQLQLKPTVAFCIENSIPHKCHEASVLESGILMKINKITYIINIKVSPTPGGKEGAVKETLKITKKYW